MMEPMKIAFWEKRKNLKFQNLSFNPMQNRILEQAKVDHWFRQILFLTWKKN